MMRAPMFFTSALRQRRRMKKERMGVVMAEWHNKPRRVRRKKIIRLFLTLSSESCLNRALVSRLPLRITSRITAVCLSVSSFA